MPLLYDVSSIATSPSGSASFAALGTMPIFATATWSISEILIINREMRETCRVPIGPKNLHTPLFARDLRFSDLNRVPHLSCALSNGIVVLFTLERSSEGQTLTRKACIVPIGTIPAQLSVTSMDAKCGEFGVFCNSNLKKTGAHELLCLFAAQRRII